LSKFNSKKNIFLITQKNIFLITPPLSLFLFSANKFGFDTLRRNI